MSAGKGAPEVSIEVVANAAGRFDYVIRCGRYFATMERCDRDACRDGYLPECRREVGGKHHRHLSGVGSGSTDLWLKHSATCCHGWHDGRVLDFADKVAKTYGSYRKPVFMRKVSLTGSPDCVARLLGWLVEDVRAELAKAAA